MGNDQDEISQLENDLTNIDGLRQEVEQGTAFTHKIIAESKKRRCRARTLGVRSAIALLDVLDVKHKHHLLIQNRCLDTAPSFLGLESNGLGKIVEL